MFRFLSIILWASLATIFANESEPAFNDPKAIAELIQNFDKAWNSHIPKEIAGFWTSEGDLMTPYGRWIMGRNQIEKHFEMEKGTRIGRSNIQQSVDINRFLSPDLAMVDATVRVSVPGDPKGQNAQFLLQHGIYILTKEDGKWKIQSARLYQFQPQVDE